MQLIPRPDAGATPRAATRPETGRAWLLDPVALHAEFDTLFAGLTDDDGLIPFRGRVSHLWHSHDPVLREFIESQRVHTPEDWEAGFDEQHLGEWYRVLMAAHVVPTRGLSLPGVLKDELPSLGWNASDARRLAWGRELLSLAETHGDESGAAALGHVMRFGYKGWLSQDDVVDLLARFRAMNPRVFRRAQHLVPLVEDAFEALTTASRAGDRVLVLAPR
jgi:hypothetical protein